MHSKEGLLRRAVTYHYHPKVHATLKFSQRLALLMALLVSFSCAIAAQQKSDASRSPFNQAAYRVGERLTYNVEFSHYPSAAHVELFVAGRGTFFNRDGIQLRAHVETVGIVNVALLSINNDYTTYVDPQTGLPYRAQQVVREAGRTSEAERDYNQPAGTDAIPSKLSTGESPGAYDLLSALYRVRSLPLTDGASFFHYGPARRRPVPSGSENHRAPIDQDQCRLVQYDNYSRERQEFARLRHADLFQR